MKTVTPTVTALWGVVASGRTTRFPTGTTTTTALRLRNEATNDEGMSAKSVVVDDDPYKSDSFVGHSLWLCPAAGSDAHRAFSTLIRNVAEECGTVPFEPHVTLVGGITTMGAEDVVRRTETLAERLSPYELAWDRISYRDAYFQCVYALLERTADVVGANDVAREVFPECRGQPAYNPHMSLVYGDFDVAAKRDEIVPRLERVTKADPETYETGFTVDAIEVWSTAGNVKDWFLVKRVPLSKKE